MKTDQITRVAVLGTGTMGPGIALQFARAGHPVALWGHRSSSCEKGRSRLETSLDDLLKHGILGAGEAEKIRSGIAIGADLREAVSGARFIVEAVPEVLELKQGLFRTLEGLCDPSVILASTTSTLLPAPLSEKMERKERMVVAHFWNPAYLAPLVEVCGSPLTSEQVMETTLDLLRRIGNEPVRMRREIPGFIGNRIMHAMNREALALIGAGVCGPEEIDRVVHASFGPRFAHLGPMEYLDSSGLDLIRNIQEYLYGDLDATPGVMPVIEEKVAGGELGLKSGKGLFDWAEKENRIRERRDREFIRRAKEQDDKEGSDE